MHQKCIRNLSQIQPSLPISQSLKYYKNQNKHTIFLPILPIFIPNLSQIQPSLPISHLLKYCKKSQMHPKCIRNLPEIYPKFNLLSLDLSHSNTIKIKTNIPYFFLYYLYFSQIYPNSTFSPYISLTQIL